MSYRLNEQGLADQLAERVRQRFAWVPAYGNWFERVPRGGRWYAEGAEARLREEYLSLLAELPEQELTRREVSERQYAAAASAQNWMLWLLQRDTRMIRGPEILTLPPPPSEGGEPPTHLFFPEDPRQMLLFDSCMRMHESKGPRLLLRADSRASDPAIWYPIAREGLGPEYVLRLPLEVWSHWPTRLNWAWAKRLYGARLVFLDGAEKWHKFPQQSLKRLVTSEEEQWQGKDGVWYDLPMPTHFCLCGPPVLLHWFDAELLALLLEARPLWEAKGLRA